MKIKVKLLGKNTYCTLPKIIEKGDWIDLSLAKDVVLSAPQSGVLREKKNEHGVITRVRNVELPVTLLPLGVAMELPKGFEAVMVVRSSTPKKWGIMQANAYANGKLVAEDMLLADTLDVALFKIMILELSLKFALVNMFTGIALTSAFELNFT